MNGLQIKKVGLTNYPMMCNKSSSCLDVYLKMDVLDGNYAVIIRVVTKWKLVMPKYSF
ncbi:hypothetical protein AGMMS50233_10070 [Endomicrobiia bacterium]|nr:hypothetical protein AGMMS50233_10070 [Endomicrobiia bacterium]